MTRTKQRIEKKGVIRQPWSRPVQLCGIAVVLAIIVTATHWPVLSAQAIFIDDDQYLTENPLVLNPSWSGTGRFLREVLRPSTVEGYYQPLTMISLMLDTALGGSPKNLRPYHRTSLILHVFNSILMMVLLCQLTPPTPPLARGGLNFGPPLPRGGMGGLWPAAVMALIFGVHPLSVEPIPWVGERKTLLASFFALVSLIAYVRYCGLRIVDCGMGDPKSEIRNHPPIPPLNKGGLGGVWYGLCILFYLLALMSKPTTTPLPVVMLLLDYWPLRRLSRKTIIEKIPLLIVCVVFAAITFVSQGQTAGVEVPGQRSPTRIPLILAHNLVFYLWNMLWPVNLTPYYAFPEPFDLSHPMVLAGIIGTLILFVGLLFSFRYTPAVLTGWLIFFVAIFPTLGVIGFTEVIASDKYFYLPMLGFLLIGAWGWRHLWAKAGTAGPRTALAAMCLLVLIAEMYLTRKQLDYWRKTEGLYRYALTKAPNAPSLHNDLGLELIEQGRIDEGIAEYRQALAVNPNHANAHNNLGIALGQSGKIEEAIDHLRQAVRIKPQLISAHFNFALALSLMGKNEEAMREYREVIRLRASDADAHCNLGILLEKTGNLEDAIAKYHEALRYAPQHQEARDSLNAALKRQGG